MAKRKSGYHRLVRTLNALEAGSGKRTAAPLGPPEAQGHPPHADSQPMKTLLRLIDLPRDRSTESQLIELVNCEADACILKGDTLGAGEWLVSRLDCGGPDGADGVLARSTALWASPPDLAFLPCSMLDLASNISSFDPESLATALVSAIARDPTHLAGDPDLYRDFAFRISDQIRRIYGVDGPNPFDLCQRAAARLRQGVASALEALRTFRSAHCIAVRSPAIELLKAARRLRSLVLAHERPILSSIEMLLGTGFREFCQSYERSQTQKVVLRISDLRSQAETALGDGSAAPNSLLWNLLVQPTAEHLVCLADEAARSCKVALTPSLHLASNQVKIDATQSERDPAMPLKLTNDGVGTATKVTLQSGGLLRIESPPGRLAVSAGRDLIVHVVFCHRPPEPGAEVEITWLCEDLSGRTHSFPGTIQILHQDPQPDWKSLLASPPYSLNPIREAGKLFGRETQLDALLLRAASGTSTFVWGQKRVGKTSLLQVVKNELDRRENYRCAFLRMGQLAGMHEGQLARTIADNLVSVAPDSMTLIAEPLAGAGLGALVPIVEALCARLPEWRFIVIIDEFDDLDPAFYTGERGRLFVKALRSLSEVGVTFLFAGSERMNVIYNRHSLELNKWANLFVDTIESARDGRELITRPVWGSIEYEKSAVDFIFTNCRGNPFFIHLICSSLFERCMGERRTYISSAFVESHLDILTKSLGQTNFAHYWEDNPALDREDNRRFGAENSLIFSCIAALVEPFSAEEVWQAQDGLNITSDERLSERQVRDVIDRLRARNVLSQDESGRLRVAMPIFRRWLVSHAELSLVPNWKQYLHEADERQRDAGGAMPRAPSILERQFPIPEDDLLAATQNLVFCGKQKDVAEVKVWLRQFDDDIRIEIAFVLLKRLTERGYISDGARELAITKVIEAVNAKRLALGARTWRVVKGKKDNLCLSYVDSELKSGASLTREVLKRMNPGKAGSAAEMSSWLKTHAQSDSLIVLLDDFSGTGKTMRNGLQAWLKENREALVPYLEEARVMVGLLYATGRALDEIAGVDRRITVVPANTLGTEVAAFDLEADIFADAEELAFAREVMQQIGRELTPQIPIGFGDQGLLFAFHNSVPNNTLPVFWSNGRVNERPWRPLFSRA